MHAFAPGHHLWFGTPTSGDVLKIVLEPKPVPEMKTSSKGILTPKEAKALLLEAASLLNADFEALVEKRELPKANQSLTYFVLTFQPPKELPKDSDKDFDWSTDTINPDAVAKALTVSNPMGFASIIQDRYITECTCESDDVQARGRVAFKCDLYSGSISFKATKMKGLWVIREFEWPHLGVRFITSGLCGLRSTPI
jgi:hypothetical protein